MNWILFSIIYSMSLTVIVGLLIITALITGFDEIAHIQIAVVIGVLVAIPVARIFTKKIGSITGNEKA
ncbi:hypothetical protein [Psychrobacter sp.]|uniref:hypothetical protein n=1 Tax=Psychrobacter sp. TaxID=56811 RepID=UPI0026493465|nr:hypothetical protein [Psychrobacter sp.]MDN6275222.1 hypothetical protein [Psychrobacter sp.]MDN6307438.1 hypothetical protein [Psychrobacter sp.]